MLIIKKVTVRHNGQRTFRFQSGVETARIALQRMEGTDIQIPEDSRVDFAVTLEKLWSPTIITCTVADKSHRIS